MSARTEYYAALFNEGRGESTTVSYETVATASLALCLTVFVVAIVVAWRSSKRVMDRYASLPFDQQSPTENSR